MNLRYYYLKVKEGFFHSETMVILEAMPDGLIYSNLLLKLYLMSLKHNGILMLNDQMLHTCQTIATCTRHQIGTVERAMQIFLQLGLVEVLTDGAFYMSDIQLLIGQSSTEAERKRRERQRLRDAKLLPAPYGRYANVFLSDEELTQLREELPQEWDHYIESRYRSRKPLVVTTNLTLDTLRQPQDTAHARIYDRLLEVCTPICFAGTSFRQESARKKQTQQSSWVNENRQNGGN